MKQSSVRARSTRKRAAGFVVGFILAFGVLPLITVACTNISDASDAVLSLQFDSLPSPSVVVGDTLRDTTGAIALPVVHAFNFHGEEIAAAPIHFLSPDSGVTVDSATGIIVGDSLRSTPARIIATIGALQAIQKVSLTLRPDSLAPSAVLDTLDYSLFDSTLNVSDFLSVKLLHGVPLADSAVPNYIVSFAIVAESNRDLATLVDDAGKPSNVDTTDAAGIAARKIRVHPVNLTGAAVDSVILQATAKYRGQPVTGSPVRLVVVLQPRSS